MRVFEHTAQRMSLAAYLLEYGKKKHVQSFSRHLHCFVCIQSDLASLILTELRMFCVILVNVIFYACSLELY